MVHLTGRRLVLRTLDPVLCFQALYSLYMTLCWVFCNIALLFLTCASHTGIQLGSDRMWEGKTCGGLASLPGCGGGVWGREQYSQIFHVAYLKYIVIVVVFN